MAPPAYNNRGYDRSASLPSPVPAPRAIQFDGSTGGGYGGGTYTGYGNSATNANVATGGGAPPAKNPYQKPKSPSGFTLKHLLLSLLTITFLVLTGTTLYFRNIMKDMESKLNQAKEDLEQKQRTRDEEDSKRTGGRFGPGGRIAPRDRRKPNTNDAGEKLKLEYEIKKLQGDIKDHVKKHTDLTQEHAGHEKTLRNLSSQKQDLLKTIDHTRNLLEDMVEETSKYKAMVDGLEEVEDYMKKREGALWSRIDGMEGRIARESWREAEEWFGPGPHRVEIELEYPKVQVTNPDALTWPRIRNTITIEMAPLDLMPHTVNLFLQQVHHQLWNSCALKSSAQHIFQLGPSYAEEDKPDGKDAKDGGKGNSSDSHYDNFHGKGLDKVSYQEYSEQYPHSQWTVGLAGRPGGPDFYINKRDNSMIHGPGGQTNKHDLHNEADPCFGKVVDGLSTLEEIGMIPTDPDRGHEIKYPVVIIDAKVLAPKENPADGWREIRAGEMLEQDEIMPLPEVPHGV